jgi:hypothetical protein
MKLGAVPLGVMRCYARLLMRTLGHVQAATVKAGSFEKPVVPPGKGVAAAAQLSARVFAPQASA